MMGGSKKQIGGTIYNKWESVSIFGLWEIWKIFSDYQIWRIGANFCDGGLVLVLNSKTNRTNPKQILIWQHQSKVNIYIS